MPFEVGDYVDFYSSIHHATNLGRLFRPDSEPLLPNWRHLPVAYHGRAGTVETCGANLTCVLVSGDERPPGTRRARRSLGGVRQLAVTMYVTATPGVPTATVYFAFVYTVLVSVAPA